MFINLQRSRPLAAQGLLVLYCRPGKRRTLAIVTRYYGGGISDLALLESNGVVLAVKDLDNTDEGEHYWQDIGFPQLSGN